MRRSLTVMAIAIASIIGSSAAYAHPAGHAAKKTAHVKVGLVMAFTKNDRGFNQRSYEGLKQAASQLHAKVSSVVDYQESQFESSLQTYATEKYNLVIANGVLFANALYHVATAYPKIHFAIVDGQPTNDQGKAVNLKNVRELFFTSEQAGYLVGVIAGSVEKLGNGPAKHNTIGTLGGLQIPFITGLMCGYYEGAKSVDKKVKLAWNYATSFTDPTAGKQFGEQQVAAGADILFQAADETGFGYLQAAHEHNKYGIGFVSDESSLGKYMLTSATIKVNVAVFRTIRDVANHAFTSGPDVFTLNVNGVGYAKDTNHVSKKILAVVEKDRQKIDDGKIKVKAACTLPKSA